MEQGEEDGGLRMVWKGGGWGMGGCEAWVEWDRAGSTGARNAPFLKIPWSMDLTFKPC